MSNWKTTAAGVITAAAGFIAFKPELFAKWPAVVALAQYVMIGGLATLGIVGRDASKGGDGK
jgi:predicted exporter